MWVYIWLKCLGKVVQGTWFLFWFFGLLTFKIYNINGNGIQNLDKLIRICRVCCSDVSDNPLELGDIMPSNRKLYDKMRPPKYKGK